MDFIGVVPAAGKGKRISDLRYSRILPKVLLPINHVPIIEFSIKNLIKLGIKKIYIIIDDSPKGELIKNYFEDYNDFNIKIEFKLQKYYRGIAGAIYHLKNVIQQPFITILGDDITISDNISNILTYFYEKHCIAVEAVVYEKDIFSIKQSCSVMFDKNGLVKSIIEKPDNPKESYRGIGIYILDPIIFNYISKLISEMSDLTREIGITEVLDMVSKDKGFYAFEIDGVNINVNTLQDLRKAQNILKNYENKLGRDHLYD